MTSATDKTYKTSLLLSIADLLTFNIIFTLNIIFGWYLFAGAHESTLTKFVFSNIAYIIALQYISISLHHRMSQPADIFKNTSRTSLIFIIVYTAMLGMFGHKAPSFLKALTLFLTIFVATSIERLLLRTYIKEQRNKGRNRLNAIIWGVGNMAQKAADVITDPWNGYNLLGYFSDNDLATLSNQATKQPLPYLGKEDDLIPFIKNNKIDELYIEGTAQYGKSLKDLILVCEKKMIRVYYIPASEYSGLRNAQIMGFGDIYLMSQYNEPLHDVRNRFNKRLFDIVFSSLFLCTMFPLILLVVAIISKFTMPGPLFFKHKRTGYDGKDFYCYKFRSMKLNKDADTVQAVKGDPRITKWGNFMRHTNIDELPQFINVLLGDMSVVGPRPHMLAHTDYYSEFISDYMIRHFVKPGITGWAQTHGERGETKTVEDMNRRVKKDIWYIEHWSFWLDIQIIIKTISDTIKGDKKAY